MSRKKKVIITDHPIRDGFYDFAKLKPPCKRAKLLGVKRRKDWLEAYWVKKR